MFKTLQGRISQGKEWHRVWRKDLYLNTDVKVSNKLLYQDLEQECMKRFGVLTYTEYFFLEQFGKHGFYAKSAAHGKTDVEKRWGKALARYCQQHEQDTIIEFGCGTGDLGAVTAKAYQKLTGKQFKWIGVEVDTRLYKTIHQTFKAYGVTDALKKVAATISEIPVMPRPLLLFPYSLDNIPPHVFVNTKTIPSFPDALLGITAKDGMIREVVIPHNVLQKKGIELHNGLFRQHAYTCDLTSWKLHKGQRAYIATDAFVTLFQYSDKYKNADTIIIDEFKEEPLSFNYGHKGVPRSLYERNLFCHDWKRYLREGGQHNLYYPLYQDTVFKFLSTIGFRSITYDIEQKLASKIQGKPWVSLRKNYTTLAVLAKNRISKKQEILPISFNPKRIF